MKLSSFSPQVVTACEMFLWTASPRWLSILTFHSNFHALSSNRCHLLNIRWQRAACATSRLSLAWDGYNRTNSGVTWNLYILFMCNRNNMLAWSHHLWTSCFYWPKMFFHQPHILWTTAVLWVFISVHFFHERICFVLFFITVCVFFLADTLLKEKTASLLELVNNTLIHNSYINYY